MGQEEIKSFAQIILEAMRMKSISIEKLAQATGISERFLDSLIKEDFKNLPAAPYARGYIMKIGEVLSLEGKKLWEEYLKDHDAIQRSGAKDMLPPNRFEPKAISKKTVIILVVLALGIIYAIVRIYAFLGMPPLSIQNLKDSITTVHEATFTVRGTTDPSIQLTVQGEIVYPHEDGTFEKTISLQAGLINTIEFKAKKPLGKEHVITKLISYEAATSTTH